MRIEAGVIQLVARERTPPPVSFLVALVHDHAKPFRQDAIQSHLFVSQDARRLHGVENIGKAEAKVALQGDDIVLGCVEGFFDLRIRKDGSQRGKVVQLQRV